MVIKKWGNSLAVRIPMPIAKETGIEVDQQISIEVENGKIIITPVPKVIVYKLEDLLNNCSEKVVESNDEDNVWLSVEPIISKQW